MSNEAETPAETTDQTSRSPPARLSIAQVLSGLPAALLLTSAIFDRLKILSIATEIALKFREACREFWKFLFELVGIDWQVDPDILSVYTILAVPAILSIWRPPKVGPLSMTPEGCIWYSLSLASVFTIIVAFGTLPYFLDLVGLLGILAFFNIVMLTIGFLAISDILPKRLALVIGSLWLVLTLSLLIVSLGGILGWVDVVGFAKSHGPASGIGQWIILSGATLLTIDGTNSVLLGLASAFLVLFAPRSRVPVFVVSWTLFLTAAHRFEQDIYPAIQAWTDTL